MILNDQIYETIPHKFFEEVQNTLVKQHKIINQLLNNTKIKFIEKIKINEIINEGKKNQIAFKKFFIEYFLI